MQKSKFSRPGAKRRPLLAFPTAARTVEQVSSPKQGKIEVGSPKDAYVPKRKVVRKERLSEDQKIAHRQVGSTDRFIYG